MADRKVTITRLHPGSVFRVSTLLALAGFVAWMIAAAIIYFFLSQSGAIDSVNSLLAGVGGDQVVDSALALSSAAVLGLLGVVFVAVISPLSAIIYNAIADLVGGVTITMSSKTK